MAAGALVGGMLPSLAFGQDAATEITPASPLADLPREQQLILGWSIASVVAMPDLLKQATQAQALAANPTPLISAALIYVAILWPLVLLVSRFERKMKVGTR